MKVQLLAAITGKIAKGSSQSDNNEDNDELTESDSGADISTIDHSKADGVSSNEITIKQNSDGTKVLADATGKTLAGWNLVNGKWYLCNMSGIIQTGWRMSNGTWYFLDGNGVMLTGCWQNTNGKWYYLKADGSMSQGWEKLSGKWYFLDWWTGEMAIGWRNVGLRWYYLYSDGSMASNTTIDGYCLGSDGAWIMH